MDAIVFDHQGALPYWLGVNKEQTNMTKSKYFQLLGSLSYKELAASAASPSPYMTRMHVALHLLELRRRDRITAFYNSLELEEGWA